MAISEAASFKCNEKAAKQPQENFPWLKAHFQIPPKVQLPKPFLWKVL